MNKKIKLFMGGTCAGSKWRQYLVNKLDLSKVSPFDPVVDDWTPECMAEEIKQREECDFCLYVITPRMQGVYSIAEVVDDSNKRVKKTLFFILEYDSDPNDNQNFIDFSESELKSLNQVRKMVEDNGAKVFDSLEEIAEYLNSLA